MTSLPRRFIEDKALRDAARQVLDADLEHFKGALAEQGIASRVRGQITGKLRRRIAAGARDALEQAKGAAEDHRGVLAVLVGALVLWLARAPLLELLGLDTADGVPDNVEAMDEGEES